MKICKVFSMIIWASMILLPSLVFSWSSDTSINTPISLAAEDQASQVITDDGLGGAIIAWMDYRNSSSSSDIYAQHIDATGAAQWTADGRQVCTAADTQSDINIISDGNGGAILAWLDRRSGSNQIYAQRIAGNGTALWTLNGVLVADSPDGSPYMGLVSDGAGGVILVWEDLRSGSTANLDVYAQRINTDGIIQWTSGGLPISTETIQESFPSIASDDTGGAIIVWSDARDGSDDVYAQRINASGVLQWTAGGTKIVGNPDQGERSLNIVSDGASGAIVLYSFSTARDIYIQKINAGGVPQWDATAMGTTFYYTYKPIFVSDGLGGAIFIWDKWESDGQGNGMALYAQSVDADGTLRWTPAGLWIGHKIESEKPGSVVSDNAGGFIASLEVYDSGDFFIYAQHFNVAGLPQWGASPVPVATSSASKWPPVTVSDGIGGAIFTWGEWRNGEQLDLYAHKLPNDGGFVGLQTPSNISPPDGARVDSTSTLGSSEFIDESGLTSHAASQWRINDIKAVTSETPENSISGDDSYFTYQLPFSFPFFGRSITSISVNTNGLIELLEDGETDFEGGGSGTHWDEDHINNIDAIFAANDDLDLLNGYLRLYNAGSQVVIEWYGATYADTWDDAANTMLFQVVLHQDGKITWNFSQLDFNSSDYDLYTGVYPNGGVEIPAFNGSLTDITTPSAFEFNPVTREINPLTYNWFEPHPVIYDSGETTDLVSHVVPDTAGLEDAVTYYWGVRYKANNNEWSLWSTPTSFVADLLPPTVIATVPESVTDVAINTIIQATFSEEMDVSTIDTSSFILTGPGGSVTGTVNYTAAIAGFTPVDDLVDNTDYTATITTAVTDSMGTQMVSSYSWNFTTGAEADATSPSVIARLPASAIDVAIDIGSVSVTFSEPVNALTVNATSFALTGSAGTVAGILSYDAATMTARIVPDALLAYSATYTVTISTDIQDNAGNALGSIYTWTFNTVDAPLPQDFIPPQVVSFTPGTSPAPASISAITVTFSEPIQNIDTTSFRVSDSGGMIPGTVQYDEPAMTAWFYPTDSLDFNTQYTIRLSADLIRDLAGNYMEQDVVDYFSTDPATSGCNPEIGEEEGCESFGYFTYGTGVEVNTYGSSTTGLVSEYAARRSVFYEEQLSEDSIAESAFESQAIARVNSTEFSLRSRSRRMEYSPDDLAGAWSMGASRIDVKGIAPGTLIPMSIVTSGHFTGNGGTLMLQVRDFDGYTMLGSENVVGSSGGIQLDFLYPAIPNNGIYVWFVAGVHSSLSSGETDYTATLAVNPPPGVTVTLASGQVFSGGTGLAIKGDFNNDGSIDLEDSQLGLKVITLYENSADVSEEVDGDGQISLKDVIYTIQRILEKNGD